MEIEKSFGTEIAKTIIFLVITFVILTVGISMLTKSIVFCLAENDWMGISIPGIILTAIGSFCFFIYATWVIYIAILYGVRDGHISKERKLNEEKKILKYAEEHKCSFEQAMNTLYPRKPSFFKSLFAKTPSKRNKDLEYDKTLEFVDPKKPNKKAGILDLDDFETTKEINNTTKETTQENIQKPENTSEDNQKEPSNFNHWGQ